MTHCQCSDNADLVKTLKGQISYPTVGESTPRPSHGDNKIIQCEAVERAMLAVDRGHFSVSNPYKDNPMKIGFGATISAPHMHAFALDALKDHLKDGSRVLDIGSGSGYLSACMAKMVAPTGTVIGVEHIPELVALSLENINKCNDSELLCENLLKIIVADGREGCPEYAPYDAIHIGAATEDINDNLLTQLKPGGRLIAPIGPPGQNQTLRQYDKDVDSGAVTHKDWFGVRYVPLTTVEAQMTGRQK